MSKKQESEKQEAIARLRKWIKPGSTVYTVIRNVSRSGMSREIGVVLIDKDGSMLHPNHAVSKALGWRLGKKDGVIVGGCGMDMGFHLVYSLGSVLFGHGDECAKLGIIKGRNGDKKPETDGGYLLNQKWI